MSGRAMCQNTCFLTILALLCFVDVNLCSSQAPQKPNLHQLQIKAKEGDSDSQYQLGKIYLNGAPEIPKDPTKAIAWFRSSAEKGNPEAESALGAAYFNGTGVTKDDAMGFDWMYKSALRGYPRAQAKLAFSYYKGEGVAKNRSEAFSWFLEAARNGESTSQGLLCIEYLKRKINLVERDPVMGYAWCLVAQSHWGEFEATLIEVMRNDLAKAQAELNPSQIEEGKTLASSWNSNHKSGGTMPVHSRSFLSSVAADAELQDLLDTIMKEPAAQPHHTHTNGCETGHWVDSVMGDGEIVKLEDGSVWQVDGADTVDASTWTMADDVTVCEEKLINTDDKSSVEAHQLH